MTLEQDLRSIFTDGTSPDPQSTECKEAIDRLTTLVNTERDLGPLLGTLLSEEWGIVKSISRYLIGKWPIAKQLLRSLSKIIDHAGNALRLHASQILNTCRILDADRREPAKLFGCEIFTKLVATVPWSLHQIEDIWTSYWRYLRYLSQWDTSFGGIKYTPFFNLIELMVDNYFEVLRQTERAFAQLWDVLVRKLPVENLDINPSARLLLKIREHYIPDIGQRLGLYEFFKVQEVLFSSTRNRPGLKALLQFFLEFMDVFQVELREDYELWHKTHLSCMIGDLQEITDNRSSVDIHPISDFYSRIFFAPQPPTEELFWYFAQYFLSSFSENVFVAYDCVGIIFWSEMASQLIDVSLQDKFLNKLTELLLSSFHPGIDKRCYVGCLQCAYRLMRSHQSLFEKYCHIFTDMLVNFTASYEAGDEYIAENMQSCMMLMIPEEGGNDMVNYYGQRIISSIIMKICAKNTSSASKFWVQLFVIPSHKDSLLDAMFYGWTSTQLVDLSSVMKRSVSYCLMETILFLCSNLNFSVIQGKTKDDGSPTTVPFHDSRMVMDSPGDVKFFGKLMNVIHDATDVLSEDANKLLVCTLLKVAVELCVSNPYTVPLPLLLSEILRSRFIKKLPLDENNVGEFGLTNKFIRNCFEYSREFCGDRQISYMYTILSLPLSVLAHHEAFVPFLKTALRISQNHPRLAQCVIETLERLIGGFGKEHMRRILMEVIPIIASLVKVPPERKKIIGRSSDSKLERRISLFLGVLEPELVEKFYTAIRPVLTSGSTIIKLSLGDIAFDLNLNDLLPDVLLLACQTSDPEGRLGACKILNTIVRYMIGKCGRVDGENQESFAQTFKSVLIRVIELAHDPQPNISELFSPLVIQCENLFSCKIPFEEINRAFIEALFDRVMLSTSVKTVMQCCKFLNHLVNSSSSGNAQKFNVDVIMDCIHRYMFNQGSAQRRGAAIALKSILEPLMNQPWSYDKYCCQVIYLTVTCLCTSNNYFVEGDLPSSYVIEALNEIGKRIALDNSVFNQSSDVRVLPPGFNTTRTAGMISWLCERATSASTLATKECTRLIMCLTTVEDRVDRTNANSLFNEWFKEGGFLVNNFEAIVSHQLFLNENERFMLSVMKIHVDSLMCFYLWCLEEIALVNYDGSTDFPAQQKMFSVIGWILRNISTYGQVQSNYPTSVSESYGFHYKQSIDDMIIATLKIIIHLQESTNPDIIHFLQTLSIDLDSIYYKFLCHPSQVMVVGNKSQSYIVFSAEMWKFIAANQSRTVEFAGKFTQAMGNLIYQIKTQDPVTPVDGGLRDVLIGIKLSESELMDWVRRRDFDHFATKFGEIIKESINQWTYSLLEASYSDYMSDRIFQNSIPLTHLFDFFFSLMSHKEVLKLFLEPQDHEVPFSASQERIYTIFGPLFLKHIFKGGDVFDKSWFVNISKCMNKLELILNKRDSYSQGDGFPTAVKEALDLFTRSNEHWFEDNSNKQMMLKFLRSLGNAFSSPPGCFAGTAMETLLSKWISEGNKQVVYLRFMPFLSPGLCEALMIAASSYEECKMKKLLGTDVAKSIMTACLFSGHYNLIPWCIAKVSGDMNLFIKALDMILPLFPSFKTATQEEILCQVYSSAQNLEPPVCMEFVDVLSHLIELAAVSARKNFYVKHFEAFKSSIFDTDLGSCNDVKKCNEIMPMVIVNLILITKMYGVFEKTDFFGESGIIARNVEDARIFRKALLKRCYKFQMLWPLETTCIILQATWRQFQCHAFNCLIVLLCDNKMVDTVLTHLVFQYVKLEKENQCVLNSIVFGLPKQFIAWDQAKLIKNRRMKLVDTGIKSSVNWRNARSPAVSYSEISISTISQDCKAFDFVNRRQTTRPQDNFTTVVEVDEDGDLLDRHECLPYLCSLIYKTVEGGLTPTIPNETIPNWMKSFIKILIDSRTVLNAKYLIVKIVYRCQEVFKPFWSFWYMPVLHALSSGCCGEGHTYFFYQVAKMLIAWNQPKRTSLEGSNLESNAWNRVIKRLIAGMSVTNDARHLLRLLRWITEFRNDLPTEGSGQMLAQLLAIESPAQSGLDAFIIMIENGIILFKDDKPRQDMFRIMNEMTTEETREKRARVIGHLLKTTTTPTIKKQLFDQAVTNMKRLSSVDKGKFLKELYEMTQSFPHIGERFIPTLLACLENPKHRVLHTSCLAVLDNIVKHSTTPELFEKLKKSKFFVVLSSNLNASALFRGLSIIKCLISLGDKDINRYILTFLRERIDGSDSKKTARDVKLEMYRLTKSAINSLGEEPFHLPEFRVWLFKRMFIENTPSVLEEVSCHVAELLTRFDSIQEATLMLLEVMAKTSFSQYAVWCLLLVILQRSNLCYKPEDMIFDTCYSINEIEAAGLLEVTSSSSGDCKFQFGANLASVEEEDLEAHPKDRSVILRLERSKSEMPEKLPNTAIPYKEVLHGVQVLCKRSKKAVNSISTVAFNTIFPAPLNPAQTRRLEITCKRILEGVLRTQMDDTLPSLVLKLCTDNRIELPPALLYSVCHKYDMDELGILITETRILSSRPAISSDSITSEMLDHYLSLTMFHENLGMVDVANYIKKHLPKSWPTGEGGMTMPVLFSQRHALQSAAALGKWELLNEKVAQFDSHVPEQYTLQHTLGFHILCETNRRLQGVSTTLSEKISSWLNTEKSYKGSFEPHFQIEKSVLYLLNDDVAEFTVTSKTNLANWTNWIALCGKFHPFRHGTRIKSILQNYAMSVEISGEPGQFLNRLRYDSLYFPADPIQWNGLISIREYFRSYLRNKYAIEELDGGPINHSRVTYMKFLIAQEKLSAARSCAEQYSRVPDWESTLEASILRLAEAKYNPSLNCELHVQRLWTCWETISSKLSNSTSWHIAEHATEVCREFMTLLKGNVQLDTRSVLGMIPLNERMDPNLTSLLLRSPQSENLTAILVNIVVLSTYAICRKMVNDRLSQQSESFYHLAEFCLECINDTPDRNKPRLRVAAAGSLLTSLTISNSPDFSIFLRFLEVVIDGPSDEMKHLLDKFAGGLSQSQLEAWLPQIMRIPSQLWKPEIVQPLLSRLTKHIRNRPQLLMLHVLSLCSDGVAGIDRLTHSAGRMLFRADLFIKFVEALRSLCHPTILLRDYLIRMVAAESEEKVAALANEARRKCQYPSSEMMIGPLYRINSEYFNHWVHEIYRMRLANVPSNEILQVIYEELVVTPLEKHYDLEQFSPFLKRFNLMDIEFPVPSVISPRQPVTFVKLYPKVMVHQNTLRQPIEIKVLASDGRDYSFIMKFGDDLTRDQVIQQVFSAMNSAMKRRADWDNESLTTYNVLPLPSRFGMIEKLEPTISLSQLLIKNERTNWRHTTMARHQVWQEQVQREKPMVKDGVYYRDPRTAIHVVSVCDETTLARGFDDIARDVPPNLFRKYLQQYSNSPRDYFYKRVNFMKSHAMLSFCHWVMGIGDRHLANFLLDENTCRLVGIDFAFPLGKDMESLHCPDLMPFRLTPQFQSVYGPLYVGLIKNTMVKCFSSFSSKNLERLLLPLKFYRMGESKQDLERRLTQFDRMIISMRRKLNLENPVAIIEDCVRASTCEEEVKEVFCRLFRRIQVPEQFSSADDVISVLLKIACDKPLLSIWPALFEPWI